MRPGRDAKVDEILGRRSYARFLGVDDRIRTGDPHLGKPFARAELYVQSRENKPLCAQFCLPFILVDWRCLRLFVDLGVG
jgi:hypothetical protein